MAPARGIKVRRVGVDAPGVIIALMAGWLVVGLLLALFVGGAVRIAEARGAWHLQTTPAPQAITRTDDLARL